MLKGTISTEPLKNGILQQLEARDIISQDAELNRTVSKTYIKHGDMRGSKLMVNEEGELEVVIDWDW